MAIRKKSETIHLRVDPISKALLEGLANFGATTSTQIIQDLISEAADRAVISDVEDMIDDSILEAGELRLKTALLAAQYPGNATLTKLRTYYIAHEALNSRDATIASTILNSKNIFTGETPIFSTSDQFIKKEVLHQLPKINLEEVSKRTASLEEFALFVEKNPKRTSNYTAFLAMIGEIN